jgi:hypothetical protein
VDDRLGRTELDEHGQDGAEPASAVFSEGALTSQNSRMWRASGVPAPATNRRQRRAAA